MRRRIDGMVVVITGASAGIGRAFAEALSARGARLALAARREERLAELNRSLGGHHLVVPTDVSVPSDCEVLIRRSLEHFNRIDTLVCNAGYGFLRTVWETSPEEMRRIVQANVFGTTDCIRAAVPAMLRQDPRDGWRGQVVIVSSAVARRGLPYFGPYSATKAAQLALAEAMRVELRGKQIAVTSVHPIGTDTEFGDVSAAQSAGLRPRTTGEIRQSAATVARAILRGIERPRPEVWPHHPSRWAVSVGTLMPGVVDRVLGRRMVVGKGEETRGQGDKETRR
jgi:short-subunit dehydrogenase